MKRASRAGSAVHGAAALPTVDVVGYNIDIRSRGELLNDRVRRDSFIHALDAARAEAGRDGPDPFGDRPSVEIDGKELDRLLSAGRSGGRAVLEAAMNAFAADLAEVLARFLRTKTWRGVERVVIGGGFREGRVGERCIGRAARILARKGIDIDLGPVRHHPHDAGLVGAAHLLPSWMLKGHAGMLAVDIGGTNLRVGVLRLGIERAPDLAAVRVWRSDVWRHADDDPSRSQTVAGMLETLRELARRAAERRISLAPVIGIGCPGVIERNGSIASGAMNLPGDWESARFNLPSIVEAEVGRIGGHRPLVVLHNDAVVQGLSQRPWMKRFRRWGILTIGTGLGNVAFENAAS
jgi:predicted NBD/HSP70 family sugar kinase